MNKILIASNNKHKISEIKTVIGNNSKVNLFSLSDFGIKVDVIEDGITLEENALKKASEIYTILKIPTISDDTGLFVDALNGDPGVYSARYAGENATYDDNCIKLISQLTNVSEKIRTARFESVICYYVRPEEFYLFKGVQTGKIISEKRGTNGFGYDPVFLCDGFNKTFAEMSDEEKNKISHRGHALAEFKKFIDSYFQ